MSRNFSPFVCVCPLIRSRACRLSPSIPLIPSEKAWGWGEEQEQREVDSASGKHIWSGPAWGEGVPGPFIPALPSVKVLVPELEKGDPGPLPQRPVEVGGLPLTHSRGGRNAAVGTGPGSRTPIPPQGSSGGQRQLLRSDPGGPPRARWLEGTQAPRPRRLPADPRLSGPFPGSGQPAAGLRGLRGRAPDLGWELATGQRSSGACLPTPFRPRPAGFPSFHSLC